MEQLATEAECFDFRQALRIIECANPDKPRWGESLKASDDPVRLRQNPSLCFATSSIHSFEQDKMTDELRLSVNLFGLLGPNGPMPANLTEYVCGRINDYKDYTLARFLDIFNHRMLSLFYRAWAVNQQTVSYDRPDDDKISVYLASLIGLGMESLRDRDAVDDATKLHYAGRLVSATRNAEGLSAVLQSYLGISARIEEFVGQWVDIPAEYTCRLGASPDTGKIGSTLVVGSKSWTCSQRFRIHLGPMEWKDYERMLPEGGSHKRLIAWVRNYVGDELAWDVRLILKAQEVPATRLGESGCLGWTTWLKSGPSTHDADELILQPQIS